MSFSLLPPCSSLRRHCLTHRTYHMAMQVTAAEAGEAKRLLVLDSQDRWKVVDEVNLVVGPRHLKANSLAELEALAGTTIGENIIAGDRIKCTLKAVDGNPQEFSEQLHQVQKVLQGRGVHVEILQPKPGRQVCKM
jgi:hypothetical protein